MLEPKNKRQRKDASKGGNESEEASQNLSYPVFNPYKNIRQRRDALKGENKSDEASKNLSYLVLNLSQDKDHDFLIEWALYQDELVTDKGIASSSNHACLVKGLQEVLNGNGFAVPFRFEKPLFMWFRESLSDEEYKIWMTVKKTELYNINLFLLVDKECYEFWSLSKLHFEMYARDQQNLSTTELLSEAFCWFTTHYESCVKPLSFDGAVERGIYRIGYIGLLHDKRRERALWLHNGHKWDVLTSLTENDPSQRIKYVIVDVETHDWREDLILSRGTAIGRIVEIAWIAYNDKDEEVESKAYLLKPHGYEKISRKAAFYHGISTRLAAELGSDVEPVLAQFTYLLRRIQPNGGVIAHNMKHEDAIFYNNLNEEGRQIWEKIPKYDTYKKDLIPFLPEPYNNFYQDSIYGVKLLQLHNIVCPNYRKLRRAQHLALSDARMAWDIFRFYQHTIQSWGYDSAKERELFQWKVPLPLSQNNSYVQI